MAVNIREKPKGSGIWWIFVNHQGKRKSKKIGRDKRLALEVARKLEARLTLGDMNLLDKKQIPIFADYAKTWIGLTIPATSKPSTIHDYKIILRKHILPVFGDQPVTGITRLAIKNFLSAKINEGYAHSTVGHMKAVLSGCLNLAVDDEVIPSNPAHRLGKMIKAYKPDMINPLNREELSLLLDTFRTHYPRHYPLALTLARTGMRLGEALALQWGDMDFQGRFIMIQRNFARRQIGTPKSGKMRKVDMSNQLTQALIDLRHQRKVETLKKGWGDPPEWIFINESGGYLDPSHWRRRVFDKALEKAGLRRIRIHDLRHTYASLLIQAGESMTYVRDQLGHASIKMTVDVYGHLAPGGNKNAVNGLDDLHLTAPQVHPKIKREVAESANPLK